MGVGPEVGAELLGGVYDVRGVLLSRFLLELPEFFFPERPFD